MSDNENFIVFPDIKHLFFRFKKIICIGALVFGMIGFFVRIQLPVTYEITATFKEPLSVSPASKGDEFFEKMIKAIGIIESQEGAYTIVSLPMLQSVIEKLGLQISVSQNLWEKQLQQIKDVVKAEYGLPTDPRETFVFENVHYATEKRKKCKILFTSKKCFHILSCKDVILAQGQIGEPVQFEDVTFTLKNIPSTTKLHKSYSLSLCPVYEQALILKDEIQVDSVKEKNSLVSLTYNHSDRDFGKNLIKALLSEYENYLIEENKKMARRQLDYLEERRNEVCAQMNIFLKDYVDDLKNNLVETGIVSKEQHYPILQKRKKSLVKTLLELNNEYDGLIAATHSNIFSSDTKIAKLQQKLRGLVQYRHKFNAAFMGISSSFVTKLDTLNLREFCIKMGVNASFPRFFFDLRYPSKFGENLFLDIQQFANIQTAMLDLLNKEISSTEQQIKARITDRIVQLNQEKFHIQEQIQQVNDELGKIPAMWLRELQLKFNSEMHKSMLKPLVHLVESKNIENNLTIVESTTLDQASASIIPEHPHLILITLLGGSIGMVLAFAACFMRTFFRGLPLTLGNLKVRGKRIIGTFSKENKEKNRELLRNLSFLLREQQEVPLVVTLILGEKEDYSSDFAQLLEKEGKKVLSIDLDFSKREQDEDGDGLLYYLEGNTDQITYKKGSYGDFIPMGGYSSFGYELVKNRRFQDFIQKAKDQYDILLLVVPNKAKSSLPKSLFPCSNIMVIRLVQESFTDLLPYFQWEKGQIAFLA